MITEKFWEWMEEKNYGRLATCLKIPSLIVDNNEGHLLTVTHPSKQMLLGYIEEYLLTFGISIGQKNDLSLRLRNGEAYEEIRFAQLEEEVKKQEERNIKKRGV